MEIFIANRTILQFSEAKVLINNYNELSEALLAYELAFYRGWLREVELITSSTQVTILVRAVHDEHSSASSTISRSTVVVTSTADTNPEYLVNFDPNLLELIRETECLARLGLEIPAAARFLAQRGEKLKKHRQDLTELLEKNQRIRDRIKQPFDALLMAKIFRLNQTMKPGLTSITWNSLNIDEFIESVR